MPSDKDKCFVRLEIEARQVAFEVGLNGVPLTTSPTAGSCGTDFGVNEFVTGHDTLWARVKGPGTLTAKLYLADPDKPEPTPSRVLATLAFPAEKDPFEQEPAGVDGQERWLGQIPVDYGTPPPALRLAPFWTQAERVGNRLTAAQQQELLALMQAIRAMALAKDAGGLANALAYKTRDVALANYHDPAEMVQIVHREISGVFEGDASVSAIALDPDGMEYVVGGDGRIVLARQAQTHAMPLSFETDDIEFGMECYFGRVEGQWLLVR